MTKRQSPEEMQRNWKAAKEASKHVKNMSYFRSIADTLMQWHKIIDEEWGASKTTSEYRQELKRQRPAYLLQCCMLHKLALEYDTKVNAGSITADDAVGLFLFGTRFKGLRESFNLILAKYIARPKIQRGQDALATNHGTQNARAIRKTALEKEFTEYKNRRKVSKNATMIALSRKHKGERGFSYENLKNILKDMK